MSINVHFTEGMPNKGIVPSFPTHCGSIPDSRHTYFISKATRPALGPNQPRIQYLAWGSRPKRKANLSPPSTTKGGTILCGLHTRDFNSATTTEYKAILGLFRLYRRSSLHLFPRWYAFFLQTSVYPYATWEWAYRSFLINAVSNSTIISLKLRKYILVLSYTFMILWLRNTYPAMTH